MGSFGDKFRKERERRGFTLDDVSNVTKINARMLKAIEEEHFDLLPGGVFNKGFIRAYAKHLGFNDEDSVSEYLVALRQAQVQAQTAAWQPDLPPQLRPEQTEAGKARTQPSPELARAEQVRIDQLQSETTAPAIKSSPAKTVPAERKHEVKPATHPEAAQNTPQKARETRVATTPQKYPPADLTVGHIAPRAASIPWKVPVVVLVVIVIAAVFWNRHSRGVQAEATSPHPLESRVAVANNSPGATSASVREAATTSSPASKSTSNSVPPGSPASTNREPASNSAISAPAHEHEAAPNHSAPDPTEHARDAVSASNVPVRKALNAAPSAKAPPVFTLGIRASETSWISVIADGQPALQETLIAPANTSIRATREITVRVGNAAGVTFLLNGKEIPPQGSESEVKTLTFDSQGMKDPARTP